MKDEHFVSEEIAKLLDEAGFSWECRVRTYYPKDKYDDECSEGVYGPTIATAVDWLEEVWDIHISYEYRRDQEPYPYKFNCWEPEEIRTCVLNLGCHEACKPFYSKIEYGYEELLKQSLKNVISKITVDKIKDQLM